MYATPTRQEGGFEMAFLGSCLDRPIRHGRGLQGGCDGIDIPEAIYFRFRGNKDVKRDSCISGL